MQQNQILEERAHHPSLRATELSNTREDGERSVGSRTEAEAAVGLGPY